MTNPLTSNTGKPSDLIAEFMVIDIAYDCKLLLPIEEGNIFLRAYSAARQWKEGYKEKTHILPSPPEIKIRYLTKGEVSKVKFDDMLGLDDND